MVVSLRGLMTIFFKVLEKKGLSQRIEGLDNQLFDDENDDEINKYIESLYHQLIEKKHIDQPSAVKHQKNWNKWIPFKQGLGRRKYSFGLDPPYQPCGVSCLRKQEQPLDQRKLICLWNYRIRCKENHKILGLLAGKYQRYQYKQKGINHDWRKIVRIMNTQKCVTPQSKIIKGISFKFENALGLIQRQQKYMMPKNITMLHSPEKNP